MHTCGKNLFPLLQSDSSAARDKCMEVNGVTWASHWWNEEQNLLLYSVLHSYSDLHLEGSQRAFLDATQICLFPTGIQPLLGQGQNPSRQRLMLSMRQGTTKARPAAISALFPRQLTLKTRLHRNIRLFPLNKILGRG